MPKYVKMQGACFARAVSLPEKRISGMQRMQTRRMITFATFSHWNNCCLSARIYYAGSLLASSSSADREAVTLQKDMARTVSSECAGDAHISALDGLRASACLIVIWSHVAENLGFARDSVQGSLGVLLFFTLSGFLMAHLYMEKPFAFASAGEYAIARFARIAPVYLFVIVACWIAYNFIDPNFPVEMTHAKLPRHLLFSGDVGVLWSIPPEVQFYGIFLILWPAVWAAVRFRKPAPLIAFALGSLVLIAFGQNTPGTFVSSKLQYFLCGALAGWLFRRLRKIDTSMRLRLGAQLILGALFVVVFVPWTREYLFIGPSIYGKPSETLYADMRMPLVIGGLVLALALETPFSRLVFGNALFRRIGAYSFSLYLVHVILFHYTILAVQELGLRPAWGVVLGVGLLLPVGWASFTFLEVPGRRLSRKHLTAILHGRYLSRWSGAPARGFPGSGLNAQAQMDR